MGYVYKFFPSGNGTVSKPPKQAYIDMIAQSIDEGFYNAPNWFTIEEENAFASGVYQNVDARVSHVIDTKTGERVGDDFKRLYFRAIDHDVSLGRMYRFDNNYWVTVNVDKNKTLVRTVTVRRCNNVLRWMGNNGELYEIPCAIGYLIKENRDYATAGSAVVVPSGMIECILQLNSTSNKIKPNQRFLFGNQNNWIGYRVEGGGINNFQNTETYNNSTAKLLILSLTTDYVNEQTDDVINGIANVTDLNDYSLQLNIASTEGLIGGTIQLDAVVTLGSQLVSRTVNWSSDDISVATVDSSGLVTYIADGTATILCELDGNNLVSDSCSITVTPTPSNIYQIQFSPKENYILEGESVTWEFALVENGIPLPDDFVFSIDTRSVPSTYYSYVVIDGKSIVIQNLRMYLGDYMVLTATSGSYTKSINVYLRGSW